MEVYNLEGGLKVWVDIFGDEVLVCGVKVGQFFIVVWRQQYFVDFFVYKFGLRKKIICVSIM